MFRILTVCTGNICRSPLAESLLRQDLPASDFEVSSSGVMAVPNGRVPAPQVRIGKSVGVTDLHNHTARPLTLDHLAHADLVLGLSRGHRKMIVRMEPRVVRKTFTLREFAHIAQYVTPDDVEACMVEGALPLPAAVEAVARLRGMVPPPSGQADFDVVDPFHQSKAVYKASRDQLVPAADVAAAYLNGIVDIFGTGAAEAEPVREMTEPDIVSQGIPMVPNLPKRAELRRKARVQAGSDYSPALMPRR